MPKKAKAPVVCVKKIKKNRKTLLGGIVFGGR